MLKMKETLEQLHQSGQFVKKNLTNEQMGKKSQRNTKIHFKQLHKICNPLKTKTKNMGFRDRAQNYRETHEQLHQSKAFVKNKQTKQLA